MIHLTNHHEPGLGSSWQQSHGYLLLDGQSTLSSHGRLVQSDGCN